MLFAKPRTDEIFMDLQYCVLLEAKLPPSTEQLCPKLTTHG